MAQDLNDTQLAILQAAEREFVEKGYAASRTISIAAAAGVSHTMLHYYFRTKEALYNQIFQEKFKMVAAELMMAFNESATTEIFQRIRNVIEHHYEILKENRQIISLLLASIKKESDIFENLLSRASDFFNMFTQFHQKYFDDAAEKGEICHIQFKNLFLDILSLNVFSVAMAVPFSKILGISEDAFLDMRKEEIIETIFKRMKA